MFYGHCDEVCPNCSNYLGENEFLLSNIVKTEYTWGNQFEIYNCGECKFTFALMHRKCKFWGGNDHVYIGKITKYLSTDNKLIENDNGIYEVEFDKIRIVGKILQIKCTCNEEIDEYFYDGELVRTNNDNTSKCNDNKSKCNDNKSKCNDNKSKCNDNKSKCPIYFEFE